MILLNQITALYGYLELIRDSVSDTCPIEYLDRAEQAAKCIQEQITFTKLYQDIGVHAPKWQSLWVAIRRAMAGITMERVSVSILMVGNIQVYADPLLEKVFYTLIDNSLRHGRSVTKIMIGTEFQKDSMIIWYEDNGEGIPHDDKDKIFARGYGNNTGLGLFLAKEILAITGFSIRETGVAGRGARFEIIVPGNSFRFSPEMN